MKTCATCGKRDSCEAICADVEKQLPAITTGQEPPRPIPGRQEACELVREYGNRIPGVRMRAMCTLHYTFGWKQEELADAFRISQKTVSTLIARGIRACKRLGYKSYMGRG